MIALALAVLLNVAPAPAAQPAHVSHTFTFRVEAPKEHVAPLFGPEGERAWAGKHWDPVFLWPQPAHDQQGAVFTVRHGEHNSVWVNTAFDLAGGHMQYVAVIDGIMATVVDVSLTNAGKGATQVEVTYTRTALDPEANDIVEHMGAQDASSGAEWKQGVETALAAQRKR